MTINQVDKTEGGINITTIESPGEPIINADASFDPMTLRIVH